MPFPDNMPTPGDLPELTFREIAALPVEILATLQQQVDEHLDRGKAAKARLDDALALRYAERAAAVRRGAGKDTGPVRFDDGSVTVVTDLPKRVDWDQDRLATMVARISAAGDDPAEYVETSYRVSERKFGAWPEAIREGFTAARTVRTGKPTFRLLTGEAR
jgi:hypothetical protein